MSSQHVTIKNLKLEGFRSYISPVSFTFESTGLYVIKGLNGSGKTSLFSALIWCLFKENLNDTNNAKVATWKHLRGSEWKGTRVVVTLGIGKYKYVIARHLSYKGKTFGLEADNALLIFQKEKGNTSKFTQADLVNSELYKTDQQAYLHRLLGIDYRTAKSSLVFGQRMARLMESDNKDKRDLFETLFDVEFVDELKAKAVEKLSESTIRLNELQAAYNELMFSNTMFEEQLIDAKRIKSEFMTAKGERLAAIKLEYKEKKRLLAETNESINALADTATESGTDVDLDAICADVDTKRESMYEVKERLTRVKQDLNDYRRQITQVTVQTNTYWDELKKITENCPYCGQKLDAKHLAATRKTINEKIKENVKVERNLELQVTKLSNSEENIEKEYQTALDVFSAASNDYIELRDKSKQAAKVDNKKELLTQRAQFLTELMEAISVDYAKEKEKKIPNINIDQIKEELAALKEQIPVVEKRIHGRTKTIDRLNWWIKTAFSSGGLKAFVFSAMLNKLNEALNFYTSYFGISIKFGVDLTKASKPFYSQISLDGTHFAEYEEYSGGQKQKIDVCLAFAMSDIVAVKSAFNILIMDEAFEGLDYEAQEMVDTLLRIKAENKAVYVISHNPQLDLSGAIEYEVTGGDKQKSSNIA